MSRYLGLVIATVFSLGACEGEISIFGSSEYGVKHDMTVLDYASKKIDMAKSDVIMLDDAGNPLDTLPPVITIKGDNPMFLGFNATYVESGASAIDEVDGSVEVSISGAVDSSKMGMYEIVYTATDRAGNSATKTRTVNVVDAGPVITLNGRNPILLTLGDESYSEEGAKALDDIDGEVNVDISGSVDDQSIGVYEVNYAARDSAGHMTTIIRTVVVSKIRIGPYLQNATPTSIVVMWETAANAETIVEYGETKALGETKNGEAFENIGGAQTHTTKLEGLKPDHIYYYRVKTGESKSAIYKFRTVSDNREGGSRFIVYSDMQQGGTGDLHSQIIDKSMLHFVPLWGGTKIIPDALDFILVPGDLVDIGANYSHWKDQFFDEAQPLIQRVPFYAVLGNHEENHQNFYEFVNNPDNGSTKWQDRWYFFDHGNIRVISLDTNAYYGSAETEQLEWLDPVLAEACTDPKIDFVFAQFHHAHISELWPPGESGVATDIVTKLVKFSEDCDKASIHFYGHTHGYQRGQTRDHAHFYMNVAAGEGDLDRWGQYGDQYNSEIIQKVIVQWGWTFVEAKGGEDPKFTMLHTGVGEYSDNFDFPGSEVDRLSYRPKSIPPEKPTILRPQNETISETTIVLEASPFVPKEKDAKHLASHFQVTSTSGDYSELVEEQWFRFEDLYRNSEDQSVNLNEGIDLTKSKSFELSNAGDYFWRVRYRDTGFKWSAWSAESKFTK